MTEPVGMHAIEQANRVIAGAVAKVTLPQVRPRRRRQQQPPRSEGKLPKQSASMRRVHFRLPAAVEGVAGFGKAAEAVRASRVPPEESGPVSNGPVTETGMAVSVGQRNGIEVREKYGAGDPD